MRDHNFTVHLQITYDCAVCLKCYQTKKALAHHNKTVHSGIRAVKCSQEDCKWLSKGVGSLHHHLLEIYGIGESIVCNAITPSVQKCSTHVRKYHKEVESGEKYQCDICGQILNNELILHNHRMLHKLAHHKELHEKANKQKATKSSRGSAPSSQTPVQPPAPEEQPSGSGRSSQMQQQPDLATAQSDLLLIGHAVVTPKEDPDLEDTLEQIQKEEEAKQEEKIQQ